MTVRCKFVCTYKNEETEQLAFSPVYNGSPENERFFKATPGGSFQLYTVNQDVFRSMTLGHEYYIDIIPTNPE